MRASHHDDQRDSKFDFCGYTTCIDVVKAMRIGTKSGMNFLTMSLYNMLITIDEKTPSFSLRWKQSSMSINHARKTAIAKKIKPASLKPGSLRASGVSSIAEAMMVSSAISRRR
jgi:hypothetical protein